MTCAPWAEESSHSGRSHLVDTSVHHTGRAEEDGVRERPVIRSLELMVLILLVWGNFDAVRYPCSIWAVRNCSVVAHEVPLSNSVRSVCQRSLVIRLRFII